LASVAGRGRTTAVGVLRGEQDRARRRSALDSRSPGRRTPVADLDGPRREPRASADSLALLLHGYRASGHDLVALADAWRDMLPRTAFLAPHAGERLPFAGGGYQWFPLTMRDPGEYWRGAVKACPALDGYLDKELARYGLPPGRLVLVGF